MIISTLAVRLCLCAMCVYVCVHHEQEHTADTNIFQLLFIFFLIRIEDH